NTGTGSTGAGNSGSQSTGTATTGSFLDGSVNDGRADMPPAHRRGDGGPCGVPTAFKWSTPGPVLAPVSNATHNLVSMKDPSVVFYNGKWHVFVSTVAVGGIYSMAYISFSDFDHASSPFFYYLDQNPALAGYHAAPEVFYFSPQKKWYLIYQSGPPQ